MLAYASDRRRLTQQRPAPHAMLLIVGAHIAAIAVVMSAKIDVPIRETLPPTILEPIPVPEDPPAKDPPVPDPPRLPTDSEIDQVPPVVPTPKAGPPIDTVPEPLPDTGPVIGPSVEPLPRLDPLPPSRPVVTPFRTGPRFATPERDLKPPYPASKIAREEEASLKLRLSIDARGRVTAVEPVSRADPAFLEAARRHLIAKWRYKPATEDGRPVASSTVITLRFELEG